MIARSHSSAESQGRYTHRRVATSDAVGYPSQLDPEIPIQIIGVLVEAASVQGIHENIPIAALH